MLWYCFQQYDVSLLVSKLMIDEFVEELREKRKKVNN